MSLPSPLSAARRIVVTIFRYGQCQLIVVHIGYSSDLLLLACWCCCRRLLMHIDARLHCVAPPPPRTRHPQWNSFPLSATVAFLPLPLLFVISYYSAPHNITKCDIVTSSSVNARAALWYSPASCVAVAVEVFI